MLLLFFFFLIMYINIFIHKFMVKNQKNSWQTITEYDLTVIFFVKPLFFAVDLHFFLHF